MQRYFAIRVEYENNLSPRISLSLSLSKEFRRTANGTLRNRRFYAFTKVKIMYARRKSGTYTHSET